MFARTELRQFVRTRPVDCEPAEESDNLIRTRCQLESYDVSAWLVLTGWAKPLDGEFAEELETAQVKQRGIWRKKAP